MSIGPRLRRARLDAGITIDQVSETTKIPLWILQSIERDDLSQVPGGVFARGYLAAFARAVGVDANEILSAHFGSRETVTPVTPAAPEVRRQGYIGTPIWQVAALIALIVATAIVWRNAWKSADAHANVPAPADVASRVAPRPAPLTSTAQPLPSRQDEARVGETGLTPAAPAVVTAAVQTTVVSETPAPVVASQITTTTSAPDPTVVTNDDVDQPTVAPQIDPSDTSGLGDLINEQ